MENVTQQLERLRATIHAARKETALIRRSMHLSNEDDEDLKLQLKTAVEMLREGRGLSRTAGGLKLRRLPLHRDRQRLPLPPALRFGRPPRSFDHALHDRGTRLTSRPPPAFGAVKIAEPSEQDKRVTTK